MSSGMTLTIFLPFNYYHTTTIKELNETLKENDGSLFEWGGWIDYKQETQVGQLPPEITLIRQRNTRTIKANSNKRIHNNWR